MFTPCLVTLEKQVEEDFIVIVVVTVVLDNLVCPAGFVGGEETRTCFSASPRIEK